MLAWEAEFFKHLQHKRFVVNRHLESLRAKSEILFKVNRISPVSHTPRRRLKGRTAPLPFGSPIANVPAASSGVIWKFLWGRVHQPGSLSRCKAGFAYHGGVLG